MHPASGLVIGGTLFSFPRLLDSGAIQALQRLLTQSSLKSFSAYSFKHVHQAASPANTSAPMANAPNDHIIQCAVRDLVPHFKCTSLAHPTMSPAFSYLKVPYMVPHKLHTSSLTLPMVISGTKRRRLRRLGRHTAQGQNNNTHYDTIILHDP